MNATTEKYGGYEVHPAAALYPMMDEQSLAELAKDIQRNGLVFPVVIHEGKILDGRNRASACELARVKIRTVLWEPVGDITPTEWVLAANSQRRHLTAGQKAAIAIAALPLLREEAKKRSEQNLRQNKEESTEREIVPTRSGRSRDQAAELTGANPKYVDAAEKIQEASPEIFEQVKSGEKTIPEAQREVARLNPETKIVSKGLKRLNQQRELDTITNHISKYIEAFRTASDLDLLIADLNAHLENARESRDALIAVETHQQAA